MRVVPGECAAPRADAGMVAKARDRRHARRMCHDPFMLLRAMHSRLDVLHLLREIGDLQPDRLGRACRRVQVAGAEILPL